MTTDNVPMLSELSLQRITLIAVLTGLFGCAGTSIPNSIEGSLEPFELTAENFYEQLDAEVMPASLAGSLVSLAECADTGIIRIEEPGAFSASLALEALIRQFRVALARSGSNAYVLQSVEWVRPEQDPHTVSLALQVRGLICSA